MQNSKRTTYTQQANIRNKVINMNERLIIEYIHRILEEKTQDAKKIQERISILNHQAQYFKSMNTTPRIEVLEDLIKDIEAYNNSDNICMWDDVLKQLKEQLNSILRG